MRGTRLAAAACVVLAACGAAAPRPSPTPTPTPNPTPTPTPNPTPKPPASQQEQLAAIQQAMNELSPVAQQCWAAAATVRFDIEGRLVAQIDIGHGTAIVQFVEDTVRNEQLASCMLAVLGGYHWAPPLEGQTIRLPFEFTAPDGQSVIDRRLVPWHGQGAVSMAVLLDEDNTANDGASMLDVAIRAGASTGPRRADRAELWYLLDPVRLDGKDVVSGQMIYAPAGAVREIAALAHDAHAMLVLVPGGREGSERAGALPTPEATPSRKGPHAIVLDGATPLPAGAPLAADVVELPVDGRLAPTPVPGTTLFYLLAGTGTVTIAGTDVPIGPSSAIQIPPNTTFSLVARAPLRAVHVVTGTR